METIAKARRISTRLFQQQKYIDALIKKAENNNSKSLKELEQEVENWLGVLESAPE